MAILLKDVAEETNLSISTISKYLNGGSVKAINKKKIERAIKKLGYQPNQFARGLRGGTTHTIGMLIHNFKDAYSADIVGKIEKELSKEGYSIILSGHEGSLELAKEAIDFFISKQVDGLVLEPIPDLEKLLDRLVEKNKPVISIDRPLDFKKYDSVTTNSMLGIYQGVEYLICKGHRKIGMIAGGKNETASLLTSIDRSNGFKRAMDDYGLPVSDAWFVKGDFTFQSGYESMKALWRCLEKPTAIIVANYYMCMGMMKAIHEIGIDIPEELSIVSMDNMALTWISDPSITCIGQPIDDIAKETVKLLLRRLQGEYGDFPKCVKLYTTFIERDSVKENIVNTKTNQIEET